MPHIYLDQNALIALGRKTLTTEEAEVRRHIKQGRATLVLSPAHWVDTASGSSEQRSRELARFIDSLRPVWLRERINLHQLEIRCYLDNVTFEQVRRMAICRTVSEVVAHLSGLVGGGVAIVDSESIVVRLRRSARGRRLFQKAYSTNRRAFKENQRMFKAGKFTNQVERNLHVKYLRRIGRIQVGSSDDQRLKSAPPEAFPSIICEWEVTKESWSQGGVMTSNRLRDLFHLTVAMPYTDVILTFDKQMRGTIAAVRRRAGFPAATVVGSMAELLVELGR